MFHDRRIISSTAYGRRRYVEILATHLLKLRGLIDEHHFWINTDREEDLAYARSLEESHPGFFKCVELPLPYNPKRATRRICPFFRSYVEPGTLYLRFDDDIVWIDNGAIERLLAFRLENPEYFLVFPNLVNNSLCSHLHQRLGLLANEPRMEYDAMGKNAWRRWQTALACHQTFLALHAAGQLDRYRFTRWVLRDYERFSINAMAWLGEDLAPWIERMQNDDELCVTKIIPKLAGRPNCVTGDSLLVHFAYFTQRAELEANSNILEPYRALSLDSGTAASAGRVPAPHTAFTSPGGPGRRVKQALPGR